MADISRADALALITAQSGPEIWQAATEFSAALRTFRVVRMSTKQTRYPVIAAIPTASFVTGEDADDINAVKPTTKMTWSDRVLEAEEIGGIVVIPENVIADSQFDLWGEVRPRIVEAIGKTLDAAVFFGTNAPATWPNGIVPDAIAAGNVYTEGTAPVVDLAEDINQTIALVEADGYDPTAAYAARTLRSRLRGLRDDNEAPIFVTSLATSGLLVPTVYGLGLEYVTNGAWDSAEATVVVGDPRFAILGIREDVAYKFLDQATVGGVNLAERDLIGLRFKIRVGFQTAQTITASNGTDAYPFAVLAPAGS